MKGINLWFNFGLLKISVSLLLSQITLISGSTIVFLSSFNWTAKGAGHNSHLRYKNFFVVLA